MRSLMPSPPFCEWYGARPTAACHRRVTDRRFWTSRQAGTNRGSLATKNCLKIGAHSMEHVLLISTDDLRVKPVARSGPGLDRCRESASATAAAGKIMEFHPARAGPLESLVLDCALTVSNIGPPYLDTHGPPDNGTYGALASCWSSRQLKDKKQLIEQLFSSPRNSRPSTHQNEESRFCTTL
jgi:hypothetical protein